MSDNLTLDQQACSYQTMRHIELVRHFLNKMVIDLLHRGEAHDQSKMEPPEVEGFTEYTPKLASSTYGSEEYEGFRKTLGPVLDHHYAKNDHHPEHYPIIDNAETAQLAMDIACLETMSDLPEGVHSRLLARLKEDLAAAQSPINGMHLMAIDEMFADWKASTMRHDNGNLRKSIITNAKRFGMSPQLVRIFENTADWVVY